MTEVPAHLEPLLAQTAWLRRLATELVGNSAVADDLTQDATLAALQSGGPTRGGAMRAWLASVLRNRARDTAGAERRRQQHERGAARAEAQPSAADAVERFALHRSVCEAVMALDEPFRTAVLLRYWDSLPPRAIAQQLGVPVETVRSRLRRGLERLRLRLDREHGDRRAWALPLLALGSKRSAGAVASSTTATGVAILSLQKTALCAVAILAVMVFGWSALFAPRPSPDVPIAAARAATAVERIESPPPEPVRSPARVAESGDSNADGPWVVVGQLVDEDSGAFVADAEVRLLDWSPGWRADQAGEPSTLSGADGTFRLADPLARSGELLVLPRDHATVAVLLWLPDEPASRQRDLGTIALARGVSLAGRVVDRDGRPVAGAALLYAHQGMMPVGLFATTVLPRARELARADAQGRFALVERLAPPKDGVAQRVLLAVAETGMGWIELDVTRRPRDAHDLTIRLWPNAELEVEVIDEMMRPVAGARVAATKRTSPVAGTDLGNHPFVLGLFETETDESGRARFEHLPISADPSGNGAKFTIEVEAEGYPEQPRLVLELDPSAATQRRIQLVRPARVTVQGRVTSVHGQPIGGASVEVLWPSPERALTDETGSYRIDAVDLLPTGGQLEVSAPGYRRVSREIAAAESPLLVDVTLARSLVLEGRLIDQHGSAVSGLHVFFEGQLCATTGEDGAFRLESFPEGEHKVVVSRPLEFQARFGRQSPERVRADHGPVTITMERLAGDVSLVARCVDAASGEPLEPVDFALLKIGTDGSPSDFAHPVPRSGNVTADHLTFGQWRLSVRTSGGHRTAHDFVAEPGHPEVNLRLELKAPGSVDGRVDLSAVPAELMPEVVRLRVRPVEKAPSWVGGRFAKPGTWVVGLGAEARDEDRDNTGTLLLRPGVDPRFRLSGALPTKLEFTLWGDGITATQTVEVAPGGSPSLVLRPHAKRSK